MQAEINKHITISELEDMTRQSASYIHLENGWIVVQLGEYRWKIRDWKSEEDAKTSKSN